MRVTVGVGARPGTDPSEILTLLSESLPPGATVVALSTVDSRRDLAVAAAHGRGWEVVSFGAEELATVPVPSPSERVASALGTPSVAEASALLAAARMGGAPAVLIVGKRSSSSATIAVAACAPDVTVVGIGADGYAGLSEAGRNAIDTADVVFGGPRQLALLPPHASETATTATATAATPAAGWREHDCAAHEHGAGGPEHGREKATAATPAAGWREHDCAAHEHGAGGPEHGRAAGPTPPAAGHEPGTNGPEHGWAAHEHGPHEHDARGGERGAGGQERVAWPSPLVPALPRLLAEQHGRRVCVLASGDPMHYGIGTTLVRLLGGEHVTVVVHPSSISLACARLGWAGEDVEVVSAVGRSVDGLRRYLHDRRRVLVLAADQRTGGEVRRILEESGFADSVVTVLEELGGDGERVHHDPHSARGVHIVAVECRGRRGVPVVPGLEDSRYDSDGQLTKREIRAVTLAVLGPRPGELLWDVGGGSGSIAIEWLRAHRACRAVAVERDPARADRIRHNARILGVPQLSTVVGSAPEALQGLVKPDAVFIGGGFTAPGVFEACWAALREHGRLVVNAVTVESERLVGELHARHGGQLRRIAINRAAPVGGFLSWRPMLPVTQWVVEKQ